MYSCTINADADTDLDRFADLVATGCQGLAAVSHHGRRVVVMGEPEDARVIDAAITSALVALRFVPADEPMRRRGALPPAAVYHRRTR